MEELNVITTLDYVLVAVILAVLVLIATMT